MKRTLLRVIIAAGVALGVTVPVTIQPAQADVGTVIAAIKQIYSVYQQFAQSGSLTLPQAVQQIEAQIQASQTAIINQIDLVAAANVQACASSAVINFADINAFTPDNLQVYALNTTDCVTQAASLLGAVTDKAAIDRIGFALNSVGPLALMARTKAGLTVTALKAAIVSAENTLITALTPDCNKINVGDPGHPFYTWDCVAYNGTESDGRPLKSVQDFVTANTSRAVAEAALPTLS
jgi:hypothetical protein